MSKLFVSMLRLKRKDMKALNVVDTYSLHRVVYNLFDIEQKEERQIQWVDKGGDAFSKHIMIFSTSEPRNIIDVVTLDIETKEIPLSMLDYGMYRFETVVNATMRQGEKRILPVKGEEAIENWFNTRSENWGVEFISVEVEGTEIDSFAAKHPITISKAKVIGSFKVTDKEKFTKTFKNGIGRSKSFGCGLLQIMPIQG